MKTILEDNYFLNGFFYHHNSYKKYEHVNYYHSNNCCNYSNLFNI